MAQSIIFQSSPNARIIMGNFAGEGHETKGSLMALTFDGGEVVCNEDPTYVSQPVVQIYLTPVQVAEIVKMYFKEILSPKNIYANFLQRLLRKRWATMSSPFAKDPMVVGDNGKPWFPPYDRIEA